MESRRSTPLKTAPSLKGETGPAPGHWDHSPLLSLLLAKSLSSCFVPWARSSKSDLQS